MTPWRKLLKSIGAGALLALLWFAAELLLILRTGAVGLKLDLSGPFAAVFQAVRPQLPGLLGRAVVAYLAFGALSGAAAATLASVFRPVSARARWLLWVAEWLAIVLLLAWARALSRPALFDDVLPAGLLRGLVDHGEPWHPRAVAAGWLMLHGVFAARRWRGQLRWLLPAAAGVLGIGALAAVRPGTPAAHPPLLVLIGIDAFRPDRLSAMGGKGDVAPRLEEFARDATLFTSAYTPIAQTQPAWRGLVTARWPHHTGVRYPLTPEAHWQPGLPTFPHALTEAGWRTVFWTDCSRFNYQGPSAGFAVVHAPPRGAINFLLEKLRFRGLGMWADNRLGAAFLPEFVDNRALAGIHDPIGYARRLARELSATAARGPTLFAYHATAAHFPGDPVYPFYRRFVSSDVPLERRLRMVFSPIDSGTSPSGTRAASEGLYDELLAQADAQVGIVLDELKARGRYDDATIVVFSDHGESFHADTPGFEGATPVHGARLSDEENRILLLVKPPRDAFPGQPSRVDALVRLIDVGPTLLELAGVPPLAGADGESLVPYLRRESPDARLLYAETGFTHAAPDAFDPEHWAEAPRTFESYRVLPDGAIEMTEEAHQAILREKDVGAFDGQSWLVRAPKKDGTVAQSCRGPCGNPRLEAWLDLTLRP